MTSKFMYGVAICLIFIAFASMVFDEILFTLAAIIIGSIYNVGAAIMQKLEGMNND